MSFVIPCLNEAETISKVVREALGWARRESVPSEVVVADNGSADGSPEIAREAGARVVSVPVRGYGSAIRGGMAAANGEIVVIGDADGQHDFNETTRLLDEIDAGADVVVGSRFEGPTARDAVPLLNRAMGAPLLSAAGRALAGVSVRDFHCGFRAVRRDALQGLPLNCDGMEFASEFIVRAAQAGLAIGQCPVTVRPAGRRRAPHLRPIRDGLRHLAWLVRNT